MVDALAEIQAAVRRGDWCCDPDAVVWNFGAVGASPAEARRAILAATSASETSDGSYRLTGGDFVVYVRFDGADVMVTQLE